MRLLLQFLLVLLLARAAVAQTDDRRWYPLSTHPGYYGYGRLNAAGELVVDWHCFGQGGQVLRGPVPDLAGFPAAPPNVPTSSLRLPWPVAAPARPAVGVPGPPAVRTPAVGASGCANGQCPAPAYTYQRGFFGFR